jgi:hypothetical protein
MCVSAVGDCGETLPAKRVAAFRLSFDRSSGKGPDKKTDTVYKNTCQYFLVFVFHIVKFK